MRIGNVNLRLNCHLFISLTDIYGIGRSSAEEICKKVNIDKFKKVKDLTAEEEARIRSVILNQYMIEGDLRRVVISNVDTQKRLGTHRGLHYRFNKNMWFVKSEDKK